MMVLENEIRKDTKGKILVVTDRKLMHCRQYQRMGNPLALTLDPKNIPSEMYEARNAVEIARSRGADELRQKNRGVEIIVSGEVIGVKIGI